MPRSDLFAVYVAGLRGSFTLRSADYPPFRVYVYGYRLVGCHLHITLPAFSPHRSTVVGLDLYRCPLGLVLPRLLRSRSQFTLQFTAVILPRWDACWLLRFTHITRTFCHFHTRVTHAVVTVRLHAHAFVTFGSQFWLVYTFHFGYRYIVIPRCSHWTTVALVLIHHPQFTLRFPTFTVDLHHTRLVYICTPAAVYVPTLHGCYRSRLPAVYTLHGLRTTAVAGFYVAVLHTRVLRLRYGSVVVTGLCALWFYLTVTGYWFTCNYTVAGYARSTFYHSVGYVTLVRLLVITARFMPACTPHCGLHVHYLRITVYLRTRFTFRVPLHHTPVCTLTFLVTARLPQFRSLV